MRWLSNLSFRYKLPLWGSALIVGTAAIISAMLLFRAYADLKQDLLRNAASRGRTLAVTLFPAVLHDDVWRAYEIINATFHGATPANPAQVETLLVVDRARLVYVSSRPEEIATLAPLERISPAYAVLAEDWDKLGSETRVIEPDGADQIFVVTPIMEEAAQLGALVQVFSKSVLLSRLLQSADRAALMAGVVLTVLLPIHWYWARRMADPLARLTQSMEALGRGEPEPMPPGTYAYGDEFGRLFETYNRTAAQLQEKAAMARQMVQSERLAAIGRLTAGIAHEINNPLAGMLTAIDTLRQRPDLDPKVAKTVGLIERGLSQIADTVRALLVEAKVTTRSLGPADIEDVHTLLHAPIVKKQLNFEWQVDIAQAIALPANLVRQVLINLTLNAIEAAPPQGCVCVDVRSGGAELAIDVRNDGAPLSEGELLHLFEPFLSTKESGHGLGLWVTYQMVQQMGGRIAASNEAGRVRFTVRLPLEGLV